MTPSAPTWRQILRFLTIDRWTELPDHGGSKGDAHRFYEKVLTGGETLQTHVSHSTRKRPSAGRVAGILRDQLKVSKAEFWKALETGDPVDRPVSDLDSDAVEHPAYVIAILSGPPHCMTTDELQSLPPEEAIALVRERWEQPS